MSFFTFCAFAGQKINRQQERSAYPEASIQSIQQSLSLLYDEYVEFGSFPGVVLTQGAPGKRKTLEDIFTSFFQLEVLQSGDFRAGEFPIALR